MTDLKNLPEPLSFYTQSGFPVLQNRLYTTPRLAATCPIGDIALQQDLTTGLIYNTAFDPTLVTYDRSYNNEQSESDVFKTHLTHVSEIIQKHIGTSGLVEVGCGKGTFLELLDRRGFEITGFDPTYEGTNKLITRCFFRPGLFDSAHALILRHVLEHIPDPVSFLMQLAKANGHKGLIYIEVPCFDWICRNRTWFDVFYEHVNYFRIEDFYSLFGTIVNCGHLFGNQYIYVVADLATIRKPINSANRTVRFPDDFLSTVDRVPKNDPLTIWGAGSKGVIFSLLCTRRGCTVKQVVDINPSKQGKYLPVTAVPVRAPSVALTDLRENEVVYVMNGNYLPEVHSLLGSHFTLVAVDNLHKSP